MATPSPPRRPNARSGEAPSGRKGGARWSSLTLWTITVTHESSEYCRPSNARAHTSCSPLSYFVVSHSNAHVDQGRSRPVLWAWCHSPSPTRPALRVEDRHARGRVLVVHAHLNPVDL